MSRPRKTAPRFGHPDAVGASWRSTSRAYPDTGQQVIGFTLASGEVLQLRLDKDSAEALQQSLARFQSGPSRIDLNTDDPAYKLMCKAAELRIDSQLKIDAAAQELAATLRHQPFGPLAYVARASRKRMAKLKRNIQRVLAQFWGEL